MGLACRALLRMSAFLPWRQDLALSKHYAQPSVDNSGIS